MSTTIDEKVVEMRFDNKDFEEKTKSTVSLLEKLKSSLKLDGAAKGFDNVNAAAKNVNLNSLSSSVDGLKLKFSAMEVIAVTALSNITTSAMAAGKNLINAFTFEPVMSGFKEYETQINAVQTILANTSAKDTTLEQVNAALDELNHYADLTIYNFTEMTRNIGTFTAAGVDLDTSVKAIQGIANLAAVSGSTSLQASTAMYQLSQALAAGTVKLQDWNSVVNAGMGGEVFQNALKETARVHGIAVDEMIKDEGSFRESLKKGWITADILTETLSKFTKSGVNEYIAENSDLTAEAVQKMREEAEAAGDGAVNYDKLAAAIAKKSNMSEDEIKQLIQMSDTAEDAATKVKTFSQLMDTLKEAMQSTWTQTWEIIVGDFEEAKEFYTKLSDFFSGIINKSGEARNNLLEAALGAKSVSMSDWEQLEKAGQATKEFQELLKQTARDHGIAIDEMEKSEGSFKATLKQRWLSLDILKDTMKKCAGELDSSTTSTNAKLEEFEKIAKEVIQGNWGNGEARKKALAEAGHDYEAIQSVVNHMLLGWEINMDKVNAATIESMNLTDEQKQKLKELAKQAEETGTPLNELIEKMTRPTGRELLIDSLWNTIKAIYNPLKAVKTAWDSLFSINSDQLYNLIDGFHTFTSYLVLNDEQVDKLTRTFKGLFSVLKIFTTFAGGAFGIGLKALRVILRNMDVDILDITARVGDFLYKCSEWINTNNYLTKGLEYFARGVKMVIHLFREWIKAFMQVPEVQTHIEKLTNAFSKGKTKILDYLREGKKRIEEFTKSLESMDKISLSGFKDTLKQFKTQVFDYFTNFDSLGDKIVTVFKKIRDKVTNVNFDPKESFKSLVDKGKEYSDKFSGYTDTIVSAFKWMQENIAKGAKGILDTLSELNWGAIGTVAAGLGIIYVCKKLVEVIKLLRKPFETISDVLKSFEGVMNAFATKVKAEALEIKSKAIRNIAVSVAILAASLIALSKVKTGDLIKAGIALGALAGGLTLLSLALGAASKLGAFSGSYKSMLALAASLYILVKTLQKMEKLDSASLDRNLMVLGGLMFSMFGFAAIMGKFVPKLSEGSKMLIVMAIAVNLLVRALGKMQGMDMETAAISAGVISVMMLALAGASKIASAISPSSFLTAITAAIALNVLIGAIKNVTKINIDQITNNLGKFVIVFGMMAGLLLITRLAGKNAKSAGAGILMMAVAINLIIHAVKQIGKMSKGSLTKAIDAISKMFLVFGAVMALSKFAGENAAKAGVMILAMSGAMIAIALVAYTMSKIEPAGLDRALDAIVKMEACFAALILVSKFAGRADNVKATIVTLTAAVAVMAISVAALSMIDGSKLAGATAALSVLMGMFAVLSVSTKFMTGANKTLIAMTAAVAVLAGIIYILAGLPVEQTLGTAAALSVLLLSLSASTAILSLIGNTGASALVGVGVMSSVIAAVATFMAAAGLLREYFPGLEQLIDTGIPLLNKVANGIGQFVGNIVGGFMAGITDSLKDVADNLSDFIEHLQPFIEGVSGVDSASAEGAANIAKTILALTAADVLNSITSWLTGGSSLSDFANQLVPFGEAMAEYSNAVKGKIDAEAVTASTNAGRAIAELASELPNSGGVLGFFVGNNDMEKFGSQLKNFGQALADYSEIVSKDGMINTDAINNSVEAGKAIAALATELPNSGGIVSLFSGDNDISKFAQGLTAFGQAIAKYSESVKGIDDGIVTTTSNISRAVTMLNGIVPEGQNGLFSHSNTLADLGTYLVSFGKNFNTFYESMAGVSADQLNGVTSAISSLVNAMKSMQGLDTSVISNFSSALSNAGKAGVDGFINAFTGAYGKAQTVGSTFVQFIVTGIRSRQNLVPQMFMNLVKLTIGRLRSSASQFAQVGMSFAVKMANGIRNGGSRARNAASSMAYSAARGARVGYSSFYEAGAYAARGFANGISANAYKAEAQARAMANAASRAAKKALNEHSPSKVFYQIGDYAGVAFINALHDNIKPVYDVSMAMANSATNGIHAAINQISKVLNSDLDAQPVIRPVVDLNGINAGTMAINGMNRQLQGLHIGSYGMTLTERISGSNIRNKNAMYSNQDVVEAIDRLEASMYNMEMVMDTGALVGSIENKMDQRLGKRAIYKGRGN